MPKPSNMPPGKGPDYEDDCPFFNGGYVLSLRVQVPSNHILTQDLYYSSYYPKPKYLIIGYMDPLNREYRYIPRISTLGSDGLGEGHSWCYRA